MLALTVDNNHSNRNMVLKFAKDYLNWHKRKSEINESAYKEIYFYEREVWWTSIGHNVGYEQDGKNRLFARPVVIVRKFNKYLFWGLPLSTTSKTGKYYIHINYKDDIDSAVILSQLRVFDSKRLIDKDGVVDNKSFKKIQEKLIEIISKYPKK